MCNFTADKARDWRRAWPTRKSSTLPLPPPLQPVLPAQARVALPHHVPLAPYLVELGGLLRVRPLALELLVEDALLLQVVALGASGRVYEQQVDDKK